MKTILVRKKHPLFVRLAHWLNFPVIALMFVSGLQIYWAHPTYTSFIDDSVFRFLGLSHKLAWGMALHFSLMWLLVINGSIYFIYLASSGAWRDLLPQRNSFAGAWAVIKHDLFGYAMPPTADKYNGAQRLTYTSVLAMGVLIVFSGVVMYKPIQLEFFGRLLGGYTGARWIHFLLTMLLFGFFIIHVAQVIRAGWQNFFAMIIGIEENRERKNSPH